MSLLNLGLTQSALGSKRRSPKYVAKATNAFLLAREVSTPEAHPIEWAKNTHNIAIAKLTLYELTGTRQFCDDARTLALEAREVYAAVRAGQYLAMVDDLLNALPNA